MGWKPAEFWSSSLLELEDFRDGWTEMHSGKPAPGVKKTTAAKGGDWSDFYRRMHAAGHV